MTNKNDDLNLIGGEFLYNQLPKDKLYLRKYFKTTIQRRFLSYYFYFGHLSKLIGIRKFHECFVDHTGFYCHEQFIYRLVEKVDTILKQVQEAAEKYDLTTLDEIKTGKKRLGKNNE